jgi:hypothetical protein
MARLAGTMLAGEVAPSQQNWAGWYGFSSVEQLAPGRHR